MFKVKSKTVIFLSLLLTFMVGIFLIRRGFTLLVASSQEFTILSAENFPLHALFHSLFGAFHTTMLILCGCVVGYIKGKYVISKSTLRNVARLQSLPQPIKITQVYTLPYYLLIAGMISMGILLNALGIPSDIRGLINTAVGYALIEGSLVAYRSVFQLTKSVSHL